MGNDAAVGSGGYGIKSHFLALVEMEPRDEGMSTWSNELYVGCRVPLTHSSLIGTITCPSISSPGDESTTPKLSLVSTPLLTPKLGIVSRV